MYVRKKNVAKIWRILENVFGPQSINIKAILIFKKPRDSKFNGDSNGAFKFQYF